MWDGEHFAVALQTQDGGAVVRRIARDGTIIDPDGFPIDRQTADIAFSGDRFLVVTSEPANGGAQPFDYIAGQYMSYDGGANSAKTPVIYDLGTTNPNAHFVTPTVAGSSGGTFMVAASASQYSWTKYATLPAGPSGEITTPFLPRYPVVSGAASGFGLATQELMIDGGLAEVGGAFFASDGGGVPYAVRAPHNPPVDPDLTGACCAGSARLASNGTSFLLAYTWDSVQGVYRPLDSNLQPTAPRTVFASSNQLYQPHEPVEVSSDGVNFILVRLPGGASLQAMRVTPQGDLLDPVPFDVTNTDTFRESRPRLASDGQGRNLLLFQKVEGASSNVYVRLFSTCP